MLKKIKQLVSIGETDSLSDLDKRKLHIVNGTSVFGVLMVSIYSSYYLFIQVYAPLVFNMMGLIIFLVPVGFNWAGKHRWGRIGFILGGYIFMATLCVTYGKSSGTVYAFLIGVILPQFLFEKKAMASFFAFLGFLIAVFFQFYYYLYHKGVLEYVLTPFSNFLNMLFLFLMTYLIVKQFTYESEAYQSIILNQNDALTQQKEEIETQRDLIEVERHKSETLLLSILPEETAHELKETGQATPKQYKLITVLFTDFKGFTQITEKISPQKVIENLNTCFLAFDEICDKYGLEKIKTIGDSYMCAGGLPIANTTNPIDTVQAGLEMQAWMVDWKAAKEAKGEPAWELRLGIHSGEAIAGVVGKNKFAYDIWGDTVNLASRMESSGEVGKVNISQTTYELVKDKFQCAFRGKISAKNKGEIAMYFVENIL